MANIESVLLVEDDRMDLRIFKHAIKEIDFAESIDLKHVENGEEALELLKSLDKLPDLIFMDINMPVMNGKEALMKIKEDEKLKMIPVLMLTTSDDERDRLSCYQYGASGYFTKEMDIDDNIDMLKTIFKYWSKSHKAN